MTYWWVNQNQTWQSEIAGGFLWSPKSKKNRARNQFYENMRLVRIGDKIFSYYNSLVQYVGTATGEAIAARKPATLVDPANGTLKAGRSRFIGVPLDLSIREK